MDIKIKEQLLMLKDHLNDPKEPCTTREAVENLIDILIEKPPTLVCEECETQEKDKMNPKRTLRLPEWCKECEELTYSKAIWNS